MKFKALLFALFMLCGAAVHAQSIGSKIEYQGQSDYVNVAGLRSKISNGFLWVQLELENTDSTPRRIYWRVKWLDESGFQVSDDEPWKPVLVQSKARQNLSVMAPNANARDFKIQFSAENVGGNQRAPSDSTSPYGV